MSVYKRNNKYWIAFRFSHQRYRKASPENTLAGAKAYEALIRQKLSKGEKLENEIKKVKKTPDFQTFSKQWFEVYVKTNNKHSEVSNKESILRAHLVPFFGKKAIDQINGLDIEGFKAKEIKAGLSHKSINNFLIVMSRCLKIAQEWSVIEKVPRIKLLKVQIQKFDHLSEKECQDLLDNSDGILKNMILVALKTGLRFGELIALEWKDIDYTNNQMTVRQSLYRGVMGGTKSNKIRFVPLIDDVCETLRSINKNNSFIFTKEKGDNLEPMLCLRWLHRTCERAGLRRIGWHTLRHTFASQLAQRGVSITIVKELLGHSDIRTTMRYSHLTTSATREAVLLLNQNIGHNMATISDTANEKLVLPIPVKSEIIQKHQ